MKKAILESVATVLLFFVICVTGKAQDYHLSQYDLAPLYVNPALAGMYLGEKGDFRVMANYRSQWQKLQSKPYTTSSVAFDMPINKRFGVGGYLIDNLAGLSNYNTLGFMVGGSYRITSPESKVHFLSVGLQMGLMNKNFSNDLLFSSQYNSNVGLDGNNPTGENFDKFSVMKFDANMGIYYKYKNELKTFNPFVGFSISHLSQPNVSTTGGNYRMPMRFSLNAGSDIRVNSMINLQPTLLLMMQGGATEYNLGMLEYYRINANYQLVTGVGYRYQDAVIIQFGIKQGSSTFRVSYDIITSPLKEYAGMRGAIEMGVIYTGIKAL
jgi:type IX secretion system PorP/SprF family membrane protein